MERAPGLLSKVSALNSSALGLGWYPWRAVLDVPHALVEWVETHRHPRG